MSKRLRTNETVSGKPITTEVKTVPDPGKTAIGTMPVTLRDIADRLGLSVSTVSRALSGTGRLGTKTRKSVIKAAEDMGYRPNEAARILKKKSADVIGVIVPDISNSFFANVIKGIEDKAYGSSHMVIVCNTGADPAKEEEYVKLLIQKHVKGIIAASVGGGGPSLIIRQQQGRNAAKAVFIDNIPEGGSIDMYDVVTIDNVKAAYDLTRRLLSLGHKRIAAITGPVSQSTAGERLRGFLECLHDNGITVDDRLVAIGDFGKGSGYEIMKGWLDAGAKPDAVFAANNFMAYGAINAILEKGLGIPDDIAVACFDAFDDTGLIRPRLTSVIQPAFEIGSVAAELIIGRLIEDGLSHQGRKVILSPVINEGESAGQYP